MGWNCHTWHITTRDGDGDDNGGDNDAGGRGNDVCAATAAEENNDDDGNNARPAMTIATTMTTLTMTILMKTMVIKHEPIARIACLPVTLPLHASCANIIASAIPSVALLVGNAADNASEISGADSPASMRCKYFLSGRDENMYYICAYI